MTSETPCHSVFWPLVGERVLRGEAVGAELLEAHAREVARRIASEPTGSCDPEFRRRFEDNARVLREARRTIAMIEGGDPIRSDAEWLLDNFHIVEEQLREIVDDLPPGFYEELPKVFSGAPRIYPLALDLLIHTDSALQYDVIVRYVQAFQDVLPLSIGEVWALPTMLRLALVENLRRIAVGIVSDRDARSRADEAISRWRRGTEFDIDCTSAESGGTVVLRIVEQVHNLAPDDAEARAVLERVLARSSLVLDQVVHSEHCRQAATQVSIGNVITSMRLISSLDWVMFFEQASFAERELRRDPAGVYPAMDFATRDRYRHAVERLAKRSAATDHDVATRAVALAEAASAPRERHVGFYLIDAGLPQLQQAFVPRKGMRGQPLALVRAHPDPAFFGALAGMTLAFCGLTVWLMRVAGAGWGSTALMVFLALVPASELASQLVNLLFTTIVPPRLLPRLEFKQGVPPEWSTFVVIPSMLGGRKEIESLVDRLELHYLANPDPVLRFALLADFRDAEHEHGPDDELLLSHARQKIAAINRRHGFENSARFFIFHRRRLWNASENRWMGWERKRGKLAEFNRLLRGAVDTSYADSAEIAGRLGAGPKTAFVITLDSDTQLPHGAARQLIGTLAHPLNRPRLDATGRRVVAGYALLQPRLITDLESANRSRFAQMFSNSPGIDPYAASASDVYQDLFGEGSFTGKGIYDVDAIEATLQGVFPENAILSHDLIEGCHARTALVSDVELVDGSPANYFAEAHRLHRWVRGDWQLLPWLTPRVPTETGRRRNLLSLLSLWKIFDNLRRSLVAPTVIALLTMGWIVFPGLAVLWTLTGLAVIGFPVLVQSIWLLTGRFSLTAATTKEGEFPSELCRSLLQCLTAAAVLPHKAWSMLDAICRTLFRLLVSRRNLLEWETAAAAERRLSRGAQREFASLAIAPGLAVIVGAMLSVPALLFASPFLLAWFGCPWLVRWLNQPVVGRRYDLHQTERRALRRLSRRTWAFFEHVVGAEDNWLPIDNLQEYPAEKRAHRISPTNEGLFLVSALTARDFGFVSLHDFTELLRRNVEAWTRLERMHGHFYNWYETTRLEPLKPRYLSTVDSGNLAAAFLTVSRGISELLDAPIFGDFVWEGLRDAVDVAEESCQLLQPVGARLVSPPLDALVGAIQALRTTVPQSRADWPGNLPRMEEALAALESRLDEFRRVARYSETDTTPLVERLSIQGRAVVSEWKRLFGWFDSLSRTTGPTRNLAQQFLEKLSAPAALSEAEAAVGSTLTELRATGLPPDLVAEIDGVIRSSGVAAREICQTLRELARRMERLAHEMDFRVLYNPDRRLFSIGFNVEEGRLDRSHYDLLCSEARLASYLAIAKGDVEYRHWFQLGRPTTRIAGTSALLSWGGTMFEYLMPALFQRSETGSVLERSCRAAVARQIEYGRQHGVPWGISESAFGALASNADYHYQSFGVPGTGLKRGLSKDLVISPYSTLLALEWDTPAALRNLRLLGEEQAAAAWGFYDALDFTAERVPPGKRSIVVECYMSHHQGMGLIALGNLLLDGNTRRRFTSHPLGRTCELLLQERAPALPAELPLREDELTVPVAPQGHELVRRRVVGIDSGPPRTHLVSNGRYTVLLSQTGCGFSRCGDVMLTRWRSDVTCEGWGQFFYLRDVQSGRVWSAGYQPTRVAPDFCEAVYSVDKAELVRRDATIETRVEVVVSPENDAEVRQLRLTNHGAQTIEIEITSFAEVALNSQAADLAHPAFQNLFVQTEFIPGEAAILAWRRPREGGEPALWAVHVVATHDEEHADLQFETSRVHFLGRRGSVESPVALDTRLAGKSGTVLDPIFSLRCRVSIPAGESAVVAFTTALAASRQDALTLADQYHDLRGAQRAFELAWAYRQVELRHLQITPAESHQFQRLASALFYWDPRWRAAPETLRANRRGQSTLWRYGISGDIPLVLLRIGKPEELPRVEELMQAHEFWRRTGLQVDLAILNDYPGSYFDALQEQLVTLTTNRRHAGDDRPGRVFLLRGSQIPPEDQILLESAAAIVWRTEKGTVAQQLEAAERAEVRVSSGQKSETDLTRRAEPLLRSGHPRAASEGAIAVTTSAETTHCEPLTASNGFGGFQKNGAEYRIEPDDGQWTPLPWSNVIAGPEFGCLITEGGGGYTWAGNSREYKLTSWSNDAVTDPPSEILFLRSMDGDEALTPMIPGSEPGRRWSVDHGAGYSRFTSTWPGLRSEVVVALAGDAPVKSIRLTLENTGETERQYAVAYYVEWVLGVNRDQMQGHVVTAVDPSSGALFARNAYHPEMPERIAFLTTTAAPRSYTADRTSFIGRHGCRQNPVGLKETSLPGTSGECLDPCGVVMTHLRVPPGERRSVVFLLGSGADEGQARELLARFHADDAVHAAVDAGIARWQSDMTALEVRTPLPALDLLVNHWLPYQVLACRFWARTAFYQCGGAYGFRDQLQDCMALVYFRPDLVRRHLLLAASRQFEEGDVQHWWHPPLGRGTRTRYSDDLLWLPFVAGHYVRVTGDDSIWEETAPFLKSPVLDSHEDERYELPAISGAGASLYEHCRRSLMRGLRTGPHGLPLMGGGDWNDGMNKVGALGQGESVWLGWFLLVVVREFLPLVRRRNVEEAERMESQAADLRKALEATWDGAWYRRAYFDDGTPLGSRDNDDCQIDSIAQSWSVFAGAEPDRSRQAIESAWKHLFRQDSNLVLLFDPAFDKGVKDPGYVKAYPPGIRENGGQYTHAAVWLARAFALAGQADQALTLFRAINPIEATATREATERYQAEPFVMAADVYNAPQQVGRAGWTWYTGSAAWMYRLAVEDILGFDLRGTRLAFRPLCPTGWQRFEVSYRHGQTRFHITVLDETAHSNRPTWLSFDGQSREGAEVELPDDGKEHEIVVHWSRAAATAPTPTVQHGTASRDDSRLQRIDGSTGVADPVLIERSRLRDSSVANE